MPKDILAAVTSAGCDEKDAGRPKGASEGCNPDDENVGCEGSPNGTAGPEERDEAGKLEAGCHEEDVGKLKGAGEGCIPDDGNVGCEGNPSGTAEPSEGNEVGNSEAIQEPDGAVPLDLRHPRNSSLSPWSLRLAFWVA